MSNLISGKEALIALANDQEVEYQAMDKKFYPLKDFLDSAKLRLKPKTIKLNNIEVPAPFEPKSGEKVYSLCGFIPEGYESWVVQREVEGRLVWRTEAEVKQVIEALRQVFKV